MSWDWIREAFRWDADARDRIGRTHLGQIRHTHCEPVEITRHGRLAFVLTLAEHYERMKATARRMYRISDAPSIRWSEPAWI